jgi:hypothetical protein
MSEPSKDKTAPSDKTVPGSADQVASVANPFLLEDLYPDPVDLFASTLVANVENGDALVTIDTNALLLPYKISKNDLGALDKAYSKLAAKKRLYLPARTAREFIKHRDYKLAELLDALANERSKIAVTVNPLPPLLADLEGFSDVKSAGDKLAEARKAYYKAQDGLRFKIRNWRGDDPVSVLYSKVFTKENVVEQPENREDVLKEWNVRLRDKIPPGYKDSGKADTGIGDFLIWKSILHLGKTYKKDMIFVTGEEKADWFVRSSEGPVFARPELIAEYRAASGGHNLELSTLADLLSVFGADPTVVEEVRSVEASANAAVRSARSLTPLITISKKWLTGGASGEAFFDYSQNDGRIEVPSELGGITVKFSKASDRSIYLGRTEGTDAIMRLKGVTPGAPIDLNAFDATSSNYKIGLGEAFAVVSMLGEVLVGRIVSIADDERGAEADEVRFKYRVYSRGERMIAT